MATESCLFIVSYNMGIVTFHEETILYILLTNIDQKLVHSLHGLLNCEIGGLDCHVITP